jgi:hypothetical protein
MREPESRPVGARRGSSSSVLLQGGPLLREGHGVLRGSTTQKKSESGPMAMSASSAMIPTMMRAHPSSAGLRVGFLMGRAWSCARRGVKGDWGRDGRGFSLL